MAGVLAALMVVAVACGDDDGGGSEDISSSTAATVPTPPELEEFVGLTVDDAGALADEEGRPWRIIEEDGEPLAVTQDFNPDRVNFVVVSGEVVSVSTG
jgi:hypothetical protein